MITSVRLDDGWRPVAEAEIADLLRAPSGTLWVDIVGPDEAGIALMRDVFGFHPLAIEDTRNQHQRPKLEEYADYLFLILNPVREDSGDADFTELDVFVGRNFVVTVRTADEPVIAETRTRLERLGHAPDLTPSLLLYTLLDATVDTYFPLLDTLEEEIETLSNSVLERPRQQALNRLFQLKNTLIDMWRVVWPQREILSNLTHHNYAFVDQAAIGPFLRDVSDHLMWIADMVTTFRDTLTGVIDLYMSAVSNRLNTVVNRLTVFTVMIGLLTVISGFYGMNFAETWPPFSAEWGVPFVLALMIGITVGLLALFRRLRWF
ncbi:MAG: magnesium/cobalt transporter CorA [Anaerolineae bacterium]|nr:magnesium/cobalt transporter CorA [Anaerolineae bacterium]